MFRLTLTGFLLSLIIRLIFFCSVIITNLPSLLEPSSEVSVVAKDRAEKTLLRYFCIVCCSGVIARHSYLSIWNLSLKLSIFTRIIWTKMDRRQRITDLPIIELTTENFYRYLDANHWSFYNVIPLPQNGLQREIKESVCAVLIMYKIEGNKRSLILLAFYTIVVMYWGGRGTCIDRTHCNNWLQKRRGDFGHEWSSVPEYVCCITDPSNSGLSVPVSRS
jgi:hypothetical protein